MLAREVLKDFFEIAKGLGTSCLVEAHDEKEIETALSIGAKNNQKKYNLIQSLKRKGILK
ncbi:MAG: hypothetical protein LBT58_03830 [Endomicrobium sp.]|nr:hypothetical protein [Endomicrobium sp.]